MSREIKFRVWSESDKEYRTDCSVHKLFTSKTGTPAMIYNDEGDCFLLEQYTGLKDKNGKEIYEGDICRLAYYTKKDGKKRWHKDLEDVEAVEFEDGYFKFSNTDQYGIGSELSFSDYGEWSTANGNYKYEAEVIGNIHENPELLGGEE